MIGPADRTAISGITCALFLSLCAAAGCKTVKEIESPAPEQTSAEGDFTNPAASEGDFELDSELCWESIRTRSSGEADEDAWAACMREKGWTRQP